MSKCRIKKFTVAAILIAGTMFFCVQFGYRTRGGTRFHFLPDVEPLVQEQFGSFSITLYSFPGDLNDFNVKATEELTAQGFIKIQNPSHVSEFSFVKFIRERPLTITITATKLSDKTTATQYFHVDTPGWVSVEVMQARRSDWRHFLSRVTKGMIPMPFDPPISRTRANRTIPPYQPNSVH